jgi:hypothetical protein
MRRQIFAMVLLLAMSRVAAGGQPLALESTMEARGDDQVVVTIAFTNVSGDRIHDARIDAAVPAGFGYVQGSAQGPGAGLLYSVDGGERFVPERELAASATATTHVPTTHIRWVLPGPFDPGVRGQVRFLVTPLATDATTPGPHLPDAEGDEATP